MKERVTLAKRPLKDGVVSLFLDYRIGGKRCRDNLKLYLYPERTALDKARNAETMRIANAERERCEFELEQAEAGIFVKKRPTLVPFHEYVKKSLARKRITENTAKNIRSAVSIAGSMADTYIQLIDLAWFRKYVETMEARGYKPNSIRLYVVIIRQILNMAKDDGIIDRLPKTEDILPKKEKNVRTYLTIDEIRTLLDTECHNPEVKRAFLFSCFTGLRISDILALKSDNILDGNIVIRQKKTSEPVIIPIGANAEIFLREGLPFRLPKINTINRNIGIWVKKAGIGKHVTFHISRHTFATMALSNGSDLYVTSKLLGHTSVNTTAIYAKIVDVARKKAVDAIPKL